MQPRRFLKAWSESSSSPSLPKGEACCNRRKRRQGCRTKKEKDAEGEKGDVKRRQQRARTHWNGRSRQLEHPKYRHSSLLSLTSSSLHSEGCFRVCGPLPSQQGSPRPQRSPGSADEDRKKMDSLRVMSRLRIHPGNGFRCGWAHCLARLQPSASRRASHLAPASPEKPSNPPHAFRLRVIPQSTHDSHAGVLGLGRTCHHLEGSRVTRASNKLLPVVDAVNCTMSVLLDIATDHHLNLEASGRFLRAVGSVCSKLCCSRLLRPTAHERGPHEAVNVVCRAAPAVSVCKSYKLNPGRAAFACC